MMKGRYVLVAIVTCAIVLLQPWGSHETVDVSPPVMATTNGRHDQHQKRSSASSPVQGGDRDADEAIGATVPPAVADRTRGQVIRGAAEGSGEDEGECGPRYSSVRCIDDGTKMFAASAAEYGFPLYNRSCVYYNVSFNKATHRFVFHSAPGTRVKLPPVTLSPRAFDLPIMGWKRRKVQRKMGYFHDWTPTVVTTPLPCDAPRLRGTYAYYSPIVAPWNYAHTLLCDLFGLFWAAWELGYRNVYDIKVLAVGRHYAGDFPIPDRKKPNAAFRLFSREQPSYEGALPDGGVVGELIVGTGTKSWSWVTTDYAAAGNRELWWAFRDHIIQTTGAKDRRLMSAPSRAVPTWQRRVDHGGRRLRVSLCHKRDKRGVVNYEEAMEFLRADLPDAEFVLESAVGKNPTEQVQMMLDMDVYICNEGTLATSFFLMSPGSAFVSLPLVYHAPHLHQTSTADFKWSHPSMWWQEPDKMRPDPRKNTGGNIDWFPPSIPWVRVSWYDKIPLNETKIQLPLRSLRNYQPEYNIILQRRRLTPLVRAALGHVGQTDRLVKESPNYSTNAGLCRELLHLTPSLVSSFNSGKCYYGMSWLCEAWTNTHYRWRFFHEKWKLSKGRCGSNRSWPPNVGLKDPRETDPERRLGEFLYYSKERLAAAYSATDLGPSLKASPEDLQYFLSSPDAADAVQNAAGSSVEDSPQAGVGQVGDEGRQQGQESAEDRGNDVGEDGRQANGGGDDDASPVA